MYLDATRKVYFGIAFVGLAVALYDTYDYLTQNFTSCSMKNTIFSCGGVAGWANLHPLSLGGVSIPYWTTGLLWFPLALFVGTLAFQRNAEVILIPFLMIGNTFTVYLWYLELDVIHLFCPVCLSLYVLNYFLTGVAVSIVLSSH